MIRSAWLWVVCACGPVALDDGGREASSDSSSSDGADVSPQIVVLGFDGVVLSLGEVDVATRGVTSDHGLVGTYAAVGVEVDRLRVLAEIREAVAALDVVVVPAIPHPARYSLVVVTPSAAPGYPDAEWVAPLDLLAEQVGVVIAHDTDAAITRTLAAMGPSLGLETPPRED